MRRRPYETPDTLTERFLKAYLRGEYKLTGLALLIPTAIIGYLVTAAYLNFYESPVIAFLLMVFLFCVNYWVVLTLNTRFEWEMKKRFLALLMVAGTILTYAVFWVIARYMYPIFYPIN